MGHFLRVLAHVEVGVGGHKTLTHGCPMVIKKEIVIETESDEL